MDSPALRQLNNTQRSQNVCTLQQHGLIQASAALSPELVATMLQTPSMCAAEVNRYITDNTNPKTSLHFHHLAQTMHRVPEADYGKIIDGTSPGTARGGERRRVIRNDGGPPITASPPASPLSLRVPPWRTGWLAAELRGVPCRLADFRVPQPLQVLSPNSSRFMPRSVARPGQPGKPDYGPNRMR